MMVEKGIRIKLPGRDPIHIKISKLMLSIFMILFACLMLLPMIYTIGTAFKPLNELLQFPPVFFVRRPTLKNFSDLFLLINTSEVSVFRYLFNSILVTVVSTVSTIFVATLGGYAMSKLKIPFKNIIFNMVVIAMTFPSAVTALPTFLIVDKLGMYDTYWALIIPRIAGAYGMFLMKQFCDQLPVPILEAARIDGANEFKVYTSIALPFLRPAWGTLLVFTFTSVWNDGGSSLMYTINQNLRLLPIMLTTISENATLARAGASSAASLIMMLPSIIIFIRQQRGVMETMAHSGIK